MAGDEFYPDDVTSGLLDEDEEEEDPDGNGPDYNPPFVDGAGVHVMRERCSTCIFRPGNLMNLHEGRLADLTAETDRHDSNVICHQWLGRGFPVGALCRGSVDRRAGQMVRIGERFGPLVLDDAPPEEDAA
jgi:hypothetical protein